uniref:CHK domain-containing protein n=1 Tax=Anopheles funestus TaxID=62324 RepID=A0A4Y0BMJ8_ANOFN
MDTPRAAVKLSDISAKFTEETLDEIVRSAGGKRCISWKIPETNFTKGDAYLSELYRIQLTGEPNEPDQEPMVVNVVVKTIPKNVGRRNTFRSADFFRNEVNFYNVVLKELYRFQEARKPKNPFKDIDRCFVAYTDGVNDFVAMDDLGQYGYKTASRSKGVELDECLRCIRSLARFHALSFAMKQQEPHTFQTLVDQLQETYYSARLEPWYRNFMQRLVTISKEALEIECAEDPEAYPPCFKRAVLEFLGGNIYGMMVELTHTRNQYSVLTHGDCWLPNFLFHPVSHVRMIDFQMVRYGSPVLDIILFVYCCTDQALRVQHYEQLLSAYYQSFSELVSDLGTDPTQTFPASALNSELERFGRFGCGIAVESTPLSLLDESDVPDLDSIEGTEAVPLEQIMTLRSIKTRYGRRRLLNVFRHAHDCGYLK